MARKHDLRAQRANTVINVRSKRQEKALDHALQIVEKQLHKEFPGVQLRHEIQWKLVDVVNRLRNTFPEIDFHYHFKNSAMKPDGGILSIVDKSDRGHVILITEKKNQGTNDSRVREGKPRQAKGNAIELLGKNVIGFRTALKTEAIFPFVCFGDGCDFDDDSSILDRVSTIAQFAKLNEEHLHDEGSRNTSMTRVVMVNLTAGRSILGLGSGQTLKWQNARSMWR